MIAAPNDWNREVKKARQDVEVGRSESAQRRFEYWQEFLSKLRLTDTGIGVPKPNSLGNLRFSLQGRDLWITVYAAASLGRIGVFVTGNADFYKVLSQDRRAIEGDIGTALGWNGDANSWTVAISQNADPTAKSAWPSQHKWLAINLTDFIRVFTPYVQRIGMK
jgi:hypothetical protein